MKGVDYTDLLGRLVRFNGLEECVKFWSYYRYLRDADLVALRFGNRTAEDSIYSSATFREQVKRAVYGAKGQAIKFQFDAGRFIDANIEEYRSFDSNTRRKKTASFELEKIPRLRRVFGDHHNFNHH